MSQGNKLSAFPTRQILGVNFYAGRLEALVDRIIETKGLLLVPAAPALVCIQTIPAYREALLSADVVITDSAFMVIIWNILNFESIPRISGLLYLTKLLSRPEITDENRTLWVMASPASSKKNLDWLRSRGISVSEDYVHFAPKYGDEVIDEPLIKKIEKMRPDHVIITVGGMTQERLGIYLKKNLTYLPGIHCIGAAIAFLSGDQVKIPLWADRIYLGWAFRIVSCPSVYFPRYWGALKLFKVMWRYRSSLPPLTI